MFTSSFFSLLDEVALTNLALPDLKGKTIASKQYVDMDAHKRAEVHDLVQGSLSKNINKHVKSKVLEVIVVFHSPCLQVSSTVIILFVCTGAIHGGGHCEDGGAPEGIERWLRNDGA